MWPCNHHLTLALMGSESGIEYLHQLCLLHLWSSRKMTEYIILTTGDTSSPPTLSVINATHALASRCSRNQFFLTMIDSGIGQLAMYLRSACWRRTNNEWNPWGVSTPLTMKTNTLWKEPSSRGGECVRISGWGHGEMPSCHWLNLELSKWIENPKQDISPKVNPKIHRCSWTLPSPLQLT